jgi:hypothetical protein
MKNLVIVTSYIKTTSLSLFTWQERLRDVKRTIESVKAKIPNPYIVLAEGSDIDVNELKQLNVDYIYTNLNTFPKSIGELTLLFGYLTSEHFKMEKFETISKISGRYTFTDIFDFSKFPLESFVIKSQDSWTVEQGWTSWPPVYFATRYYRFNADDVEYFLSMLKTSFEDMARIDIEHSFYKNCQFPKDKMCHPNYIGVTGILAPTGQVIED